MQLYQVDAFASRPFAGNPAGVCLLDQPAEAGWMHALAVELNLPKVAFVCREDAAARRFHLRWFGVTGESNLCGHATLATAHVLWESGAVPAGETIEFSTLGGPLAARDASAGWIELDFPAEPAAAEDRPALADLLGIQPVWMGHNGRHFLIEVASDDVVRGLQPDFPRLAGALAPAHGVIVTARGALGEHDFVSRCFAPAIGVDEDAVTGSAHCSLAPYWSAKLGKREMLAFQASARGGELRVRVDGDRVHIAGQAVSVFQGRVLGSAFHGETFMIVTEAVLKRFDNPDETRSFDKGRFDVVRIGGMTLGLATSQPGWKWSLHVRPQATTDLCEVEHVGMVLSGRAMVAMADGKQTEMAPGTLFHIPPTPHDSWVIGDEPYVSLHLMGAADYTR